MTDQSAFKARLKRRHFAQARFKTYGIAAIAISIGFLFLMVGSIFYRGIGAFTQTYISVPVTFSQQDIDPENTRNPEVISAANYNGLVKQSLRAMFPDVTTRSDKRQLYELVSSQARFALADRVTANPDLIGTTTKIWMTASDEVDLFMKGAVDRALPADQRRISDKEIAWIDSLVTTGQIERRFNWTFLTTGDSREPEQAGLFGALVGSALSLLVCFLLAFPVGILSAVYLEEFARKGRLSTIIEVNINNLAAVPSIVFGLLGLAILLGVFGLPRSTPLVGGIVLALMTLPTVIIASRASLRAVPPSIREAALGLGASDVQTTFHHVVPLAMPGMLTGAIIGMAQALGETAPLLMIGMVAFIVDVPHGFTDAATALPVQIFLWADAPERAFMEKASAAIIVLLVFLVLTNLIAIILRNKLARRW